MTHYGEENGCDCSNKNGSDPYSRPLTKIEREQLIKELTKATDGRDIVIKLNKNGSVKASVPVQRCQPDYSRLRKRVGKLRPKYPKWALTTPLTYNSVYKSAIDDVLAIIDEESYATRKSGRH